MKYLLTGVAAITMLTACGQKDKPGQAEAPSGIVFSQEKIPEYKVQNGDSETATAALAAMALDRSGAGNASWGGVEVKGDKAVFTDVTLRSVDEEDEADVSLDLDEDGDPDFSMDYDSDGEGLDIDGSDLKIAKMEFDGLGLKDGKANFSRLLMSDIAIVPQDPEEADKGSGTIGSIELVNPSPETAAWVASLFADSEKQDLPRGDALAFDHWAMKDLDFRIDNEEEGEQGNFTIGTMEVTGLKDSTAALMTLAGMAFDLDKTDEGTQMTMALDAIEMRGVDLKLLSEAGEEAVDPEDVSRMVNLTAQDPADPGYESMTIDGFTMDMAGVKMALPKLVSAVGRDSRNSVVAVRTDPFRISLSTGEGKYGEMLGAQLATLGYKTVDLTGAGYKTYEPAADLTTYVKGRNYWELKGGGSADIEDTRSRKELLARAAELGLDVPGNIGEADLKAKVADREANGLRIDFSMQYAGAREMAKAEAERAYGLNPASVVGSTLDDMVLHGLEFSIADNGFVDRAFNAYAAQTNQDPQDARGLLASYLAMAPIFAMQMGIDSELATEASTALSSFVTNPKTLIIKMAPQEPVVMSALADMEDPSQMTREALGFEASNK